MSTKSSIKKHSSKTAGVPDPIQDHDQLMDRLAELGDEQHVDNQNKKMSKLDEFNELMELALSEADEELAGLELPADDEGDEGGDLEALLGGDEEEELDLGDEEPSGDIAGLVSQLSDLVSQIEAAVGGGEQELEAEPDEDELEFELGGEEGEDDQLDLDKELEQLTGEALSTKPAKHVTVHKRNVKPGKHSNKHQETSFGPSTKGGKAKTTAVVSKQGATHAGKVTPRTSQEVGCCTPSTGDDLI